MNTNKHRSPTISSHPALSVDLMESLNTPSRLHAMYATTKIPWNEHRSFATTAATGGVTRAATHKYDNIYTQVASGSVSPRFYNGSESGEIDGWAICC